VTAQQALSTHPELLARWHAWQASRNERDVVAGGNKPRVDLSAGLGRERLHESGQDQDFSTRTLNLTLTQLLYDGGGVKNETQRFQYLSTVRLYEFFSSAEAVALDVTRAWFDVLRYRKLLTLAEDNYVQHKAVFEQIQDKVKAGVARRVDLEQATGRLALAEANLVTETSNLHDVSARFQRLTGTFPAKEMESRVIMEKDLPPNITSALRAAIARHPALRAAIENVRSAGAAAKLQQAAFAPRVDFRLRSEHDQNPDRRSIGSRRDNTAEVVMSWNLFNGGSDQSRVRQYADLLNQARDERERACIDVRQNLTVAYNDARKLTEQLTYFDQHQLAIDKARQAYRKQFEIGQRTLLDVLDTENELFQARRSHTNAEFDLQIAYARAHAGFGGLVSLLNANLRPGETLPDLSRDNLGDAVASCGPETPPLYNVDRAVLDQRARDLLKEGGLGK
jgi:adhesin transport system outer membrane protein